VLVDTSRCCQVIEGFGGAFTDAAASVWQAPGEASRETLLHDRFDPLAGHGYTLCRVHMNSCDSAPGNYAHVERSDDFALDSFSIERGTPVSPSA
jgi:glucosylceramidase